MKWGLQCLHAQQNSLVNSFLQVFKSASHNVNVLDVGESSQDMM